MTYRCNPDIDMERVAHGAAIDISQWAFFDDENPWRDLLMAGCAVAATRALRTMLEENPPTLEFPYAWVEEKTDGIGGPGVEDPVMLHLGLSLGEDPDEQVVWQISLEKCVDYLIHLNVSGDIQKCEGEARVICNNVAARLRELALKLDDACAEQDRPKQAISE